MNAPTHTTSLSGSGIGLALLLGALVLHQSPPLAAQEAPGASIPLTATAFDIIPLAAGETTGQVAFVVDDTDFVSFAVRASVDGLTASVEAPGGEILDASTIESFGGTLAVFEVPIGGGEFTLPSLEPGFHQHFDVPSLGPGAYTVRLDAPAPLAQAAVALVQVQTRSPVVAGLLTTTPEVRLGDPAVLVAAVFEDEAPVVGATVIANLVLNQDPPVAPTQIALSDDGLAFDNLAGDGLYSGSFVPAVVGNYSAAVAITGTTTGGSPFRRDSGAEIRVFSPRASLPAAPGERRVDDNEDGLFERLIVDVSVDVAEASTHAVYVVLRTASGVELLGSSLADLPAGAHVVEVAFSANTLRAAGEDGPFDIASVELLFLGPDGVEPAAALSDAGQTQAHPLDEWQRPTIAFGTSVDVAEDTDGNGLFDALTVSLDVDVPVGGDWTWSAALSDADGRQIGVALGEATLVDGANTIALAFDGTAIGQHGRDGPYWVAELLLGRTQIEPLTRVGADVAVTQAYLFTQFEGAAPRATVPDLAGLSEATAETALSAVGLTVFRVDSARDSTVPAGDVITQTPAPGIEVGEGYGVAIVVSEGPSLLPLPDLTGLSQEGAETLFAVLGLTLGNVTGVDALEPTGTVIGQSPSPGTALVEGSTVDLTISLAPSEVPDLVGLQQDAAEALLTQLDLALGTVTLALNDTVPEGAVIAQSYLPGGLVPFGTAIDVFVSLGQPTVPDVVGLEQTVATDAILAASLGAQTIGAPSATVPVDEVMSQEPAPGARVPIGSVVSLLVSTGTDAVVPDVSGLSQSAAEIVLASEGLVVGAITRAESDTVPIDHVVDQSPASGTATVAGSAVDLVLSDGAAGVATVPNLVGLTQSEAEAAILAAGFTVGDIFMLPSPTVPAGLVSAQLPLANTVEPLGTAILFAVSTGPAQTPLLRVQKSAPETAFQGDTIEYLLTYQNNGASEGTDVVVRDTLPVGGVFVSASDGGTYDAPSRRVTWSLGSVGPGESGQLSLRVSSSCGTATLTNNLYSIQGTGTGQLFGPAVTTTLAPNPTDPVLVEVDSVPEVSPPVPPGTLMTHTIRLTNTIDAARGQLRISLNSGGGMRFESVLDAAGGFFTMTNAFNWSWSGPLGPSEVAEIVLTSRVDECLNPSFDEVGLNDIQVFTVCPSTLAGQAQSPRLAVIHPVEASVVATNLLPPQVTPFGAIIQVAPVGQELDLLVTLENPLSEPVTGLAVTLPLTDGVAPVGDPPFIDPVDPGLSYDAGGQTVTFSGELAAFESRTFGLRVTQDGGACRGDIFLDGGFDGCSNTVRADVQILFTDPPSEPHLVGVDNFAGLWSFVPGVDTEPQSQLCVGVEILTGLADGPEAELWVAGVPSFRFHPALTEIQFVPDDVLGLLLLNLSDVAVDATTDPATAVFVGTDSGAGEGVVLRFDDPISEPTLIISDPALGGLSRVEVDPEGRIVALANAGLVRIDPSGPLPLAPGSYEVLDTSIVLSMADQLPEPFSQFTSLLSRERDLGDDYVVGASQSFFEDFGDPAALPIELTTVTSLATLDRSTGDLTVVDEVLAAQVFRSPGGIQPLPDFLNPLLDPPPFAMTVGPGGDVYFATANPGSISVVHRLPSVSAEVLVAPSESVLRAADLTWIDPSLAPTLVDLSIDKAAPAIVEVGQTWTYTLTIDNQSADTATGLTVTDELPAGLALVDLPPSCLESDGVVTCTLASLAAAENVALEIDVVADAPNAIVNVASVEAADRDPNLTNNLATATTEVVPPPNQAPEVVIAGGDQTTFEGDMVVVTATFSDPDSPVHTALIDWGDGSPFTRLALTEADGLGNAFGAHVYADDGLYTATVTIADDAGDAGEASIWVLVDNLPPVVDAGGDQSVGTGETVTLDPASFFDPGTLDTQIASIDWGDGSPVEDATLIQELGAGEVLGSHTFPAGGSFDVEVIVTDDDDGTGSDTLTVTVVASVCGDTVVEGSEDCDLGDDNGQPGFCCSGSCQFEPATAVCRVASDLCDAAELCTGASEVCPSDVLYDDQTACRPAATLCDIAETCDGINAACPADAFAALDTPCQQELMDFDGLADQSPVGDHYGGGAGLDFGVTFSDNAAVLVDADEPSAGAVICGVDGASLVLNVAGGFTSGLTLSYTGFVDAYDDPDDDIIGQVRVYDGPDATGSVLVGPIDLEVQPAEGDPDPPGPRSPLVEVGQTFAGTALSVELLVPADCGVIFDDITLGAPLPICDRENSCDGNGVCADGDFFGADDARACRGDQGDTSGGVASCDAIEICDGTGPFCPEDAFQSEDVECRVSLGLCDPAELCTGSNATCPADALRPSETLCRESLGDCDPEEVCLGDSPQCPANVLEPSTTVCRPGAGDCDVAEQCTGLDAACPEDGFSSGGECREATGDCDVAEACDGTSADCPTDDVESLGTVCRDSAGVCDPVEACDGASKSCPTDAFDTTTTCRPAAHDCDATEVCDGSGATCPTDLPASDDTPCGDTGVTACTLADTCDGAGHCLANHVTAGADCGDPAATACTQADSCDGVGSCLANHATEETPCGSATATECDGADSCDGDGTCLTHLVDNGTSCGGDGPFCLGLESCLGGLCLGAGDPCGAGTACDEELGACVPTCGDGEVGDDEACDDGNVDDLDGCAHDCTVEVGWSCQATDENPTSSCATECGDGLLGEGGEDCDDGNTDNHDGCSDGCVVEDGFDCAFDDDTGLDVCFALCGDGLIVGFEQCDDGNDVAHDGCLDCLVEDGFDCAGEPSECSPIVTCGDGSVGAGEECDDGNPAGGDGCSADCAVETGFDCDGGEPSVCHPIVCGDGRLAADEACDDDNDLGEDGCSAECAVEDGYACAEEPSVCQTVCGDGLVRGDEACDDGNNVDDDGCSLACTVGDFFTCDDSEPSQCMLDIGGDDDDLTPRASGCCAQSRSSVPPGSFWLLAAWFVYGGWRRRRRRAAERRNTHASSQPEGSQERS